MPFCSANVDGIAAELWTGADAREGQGHVPPKAPSNFFTNIILHRRVLFYKFTDITVMFLSRNSLYWACII